MSDLSIIDDLPEIREIQNLAVYLVTQYGYAGVFAALFISNATILLPVPGILVIFIGATFLDPLGVALAGALGAAIGELTGYGFGRAGRKVTRRLSELEAARRMFARYGIWTIFAFAALPLPFDLVGILSGVLAIRVVVFFILTFAGKLTAYTLYAYTGRRGLGVIAGLSTGSVDPAGILFLIIVIAFVILSVTYWSKIVVKKSSEPIQSDKDSEV